MPITVYKRDDKYDVIVSPPHAGGRHWRSSEPLTANQVVQKLEELGCHQTDIGDAMFDADPLWMNRLDET